MNTHFKLNAYGFKILFVSPKLSYYGITHVINIDWAVILERWASFLCSCDSTDVPQTT